MDTAALLAFAQEKLDDLKAQNMVVLDVHSQTTMTDYMVIAEGTSTQHVRALANNVRQSCKDAGIEVFGCEGQEDGDWVLVDLGDVIAHVMLPETRQYYELEKLWSVDDDSECA